MGRTQALRFTSLLRLESKAPISNMSDDDFLPQLGQRCGFPLHPESRVKSLQITFRVYVDGAYEEQFIKFGRSWDAYSFFAQIRKPGAGVDRVAFVIQLQRQVTPRGWGPYAAHEQTIKIFDDWTFSITQWAPPKNIIEEI